MPFRPRLFASAAAWTIPPARPYSLPHVACASPARLVDCRCRAFHTSGSGRLRAEDEGKNHYERLNVRYDATPAEIKKSFYALSKSHHPDVNPGDKDAAHTFSRISESYHILSSPTRRAVYDRDVLRLHHDRPTASAHRGSYHSTNPAGGRSPSGLSRRRGTFRGPPPSFYRSGGWGAHSEKRKQAHEESTGTGDNAASAAGGAQHAAAGDGPASGTYGQYGGMGPGGDPFGHRDEVPHFDKEGHTRTHRRQDERRSQRGRRAINDDDIEFEPQTSLAGHFFIVSGILAATFLAPLVYLQLARENRKKKEVS